MCRLVFNTYSCGCKARNATDFRHCPSFNSAMNLAIPEGTAMHDMLTKGCVDNMAMGVIKESVDRVCVDCSEGVDPAVLVATRQEKWSSDVEKLREESRLSAARSEIEEMASNEEERWVTEAGPILLISEVTSSEEWSLGSSELEQAKEAQEEEDAKIQEAMEEEDREIDEEERTRLAMADGVYHRRLMTAAYHGSVHYHFNKLLQKVVAKQDASAAGGPMPGPVQEDNAMATELDGAEARDKEAVEAPGDGGAVGITVAEASGIDQPLLVAGDMPTESAPLGSNTPGVVDGGTVPIPAKFAPRTESENVVSGMEGIPFTENVADACTEEYEKLRETTKVYLAIKAAMGERSIGFYEFVTDVIATSITGFILGTVARVAHPVWNEQRVIRDAANITAVGAAADAKTKENATIGDWLNKSEADLVAAWKGRAKTPRDIQANKGGASNSRATKGAGEGLSDADAPQRSTCSTPLGSDASQLFNRGSGRRRRRGRGRGRGRGGERGRGQYGSRPQGTESVIGGFPEGSQNFEASLLPTPRRSSRLDALRNRGSAKGIVRGKGRESGRATESFAKSSKDVETPQPPILDKSQMVDNSKLGIMNRRRDPGTTGSHLQVTEGVAEGSKAVETPLPPAPDKSMMVYNSQLDKRKWPEFSDPIGSHLRASEGPAEFSVEGSKDAETSTSPTLDKHYNLDASKVPRGGGGEEGGGEREEGANAREDIRSCEG